MRVFSSSVNLEAVTILRAILYSFAVVFVYIFAFCDEEKKLLYLHNCTYLIFDLTVTLNRKITLVIYFYIICNSLRNNSSLDAEH